MRYILQGGNHCDEVGRIYKSGEVVSSLQPLDAMFPGKFTKLPDPVMVAEAPKPPAPVKAKVDEADTVGFAIKRGLVKDVTGQFDEAKELSLVVVKSGTEYSVFDCYDSTTPLNRIGMKKKLDVVKFLNNYGSNEE